MPRRESERVEVVANGFDLAIVDDLVAEPREDVLDVAPRLGRRMERTAAAWPQRPEQLGGERDVDALGLEPPVDLRALELGLPRLDGLLDRLTRGVQRHAGLAVADVAQRELQ